MASLAGKAKNRIASQRLGGALSQRYGSKQSTVTGTVAGRNLVSVGGRLVYAAGLDGYAPGDAVTLTNAGTPGLAQYTTAGNNMAVQIVAGSGGSGGSGGVTDHGLLSGLGDDDHPQYLTDGRAGLLYVPLTRTITAGNGLTGGGALSADRALAVGAGDGIVVNADTVALNPTIAGAALSYASGVLAVVPGEGLEIEADAIGLAASVAGSGLTYAAGVLNVAVANTGAAGLTVEADAVRLTSSSAPSGNASVLATDANGGVNLNDNLLRVDGANRRVGIGRAPSGAALDVLAQNNADHTQRLKQKTGQTGRLWRVEDAAGDELIVLDSVGNLQSGRPGFVSGLTGWQVTPWGDAEFNNGRFRGELHATVMVFDEVNVRNGTDLITPAGGALELDATLTNNSTPNLRNVRTTAFADQDYLDYRSTSATGSGTGITARAIENVLEIKNPDTGRYKLFRPRELLRSKVWTGTAITDIWMIVNVAEDRGTHWAYYVQIVSGTLPVTLTAGAAVADYGLPGDGAIRLSADDPHGPLIDIFTIGERPWQGDICPHVRLGRLDGVGLPGVSGIRQWGMVASLNLADANSPYFVASNLQLKSYRIDSYWNDGTNDTGRIGSDGTLKFGTNIGQAATTGLSFDPETGTVQIGAPDYPYAVKIYGELYLPDGQAIETMRWRGTWASGTEYAKQDAVNYGGSSWITDAAHTASGANAPGTGIMWSVLAQQGNTGATGATGATGPAGQSMAVQYSVTGAGSWHTTFAAGDIYMRQSTNGGSTWSDPIRIVGEEGAPGTDGNYIRYVFRRAASAPATPSGNSVPSGWYDDPPAADGNPLWMSKATQTPGGVTQGAWSAPVRITGDTGTAGANAKLVKLVASSQVFSVDNLGIATPSSITLTAIGQNVTGSPSYTVIAGTAALTGSNPWTLAYNGLTTASATLRVTWDGVSDEVTIVKVAAGADGLPALTVVMSNEAHTLPASSVGVVGSYVGSGAQVQVYEGATALAAGGSTGARFSVALVSDMLTNARTTAFSDQDYLDYRTTSSSGSGTGITARSLPITPGAVTYSGTTATIADHSGMSDRLDLLALNWQVSITRSTGQTANVTKVQALAKSKQGLQGPTGLDNQDFAFLVDAEASMTGKSAGLYVAAEKLGYWNGTAFASYIDNAGNFKFGAAGALEYSASANQLRGRTSETTQWYVDGNDGKFYAGGGNVGLTSAGIGLKSIDTQNYSNTQSAITWAETLPDTNVIAKLQAVNASGDANYLWAYSRATKYQDGSAVFGNRADNGDDTSVWGASIHAKTEWENSAWKKSLVFAGDAAFDGNVTVAGSLKKYRDGTYYDVSLSDHEHAYSPTGHTHDYAASSHTHNYAASSHTHAYLPTSGGTVNGALVVEGTLSTGVNTSNSVDSTYYLDIGLWKDTTSDPAAPNSNKVRLFVRKNSANRLELYALFPGAGGTTRLAVSAT